MDASSVDLSWLPNDADEQLALGFRVISNAYKTRITTLEAELRSLRSVVTEKSDHLAAVQKKYSSLEVQLIESTQRGNQLSDENKNLVSTIKKLQKDINRLESLKKAVLSSIQEDNNENENAQRFYSSDDIIHNVAPRTMLELNSEGVDINFISKLNLKGTRNNNASLLGERETIDGRQFFKNAKNILNSEDFSSFLSSIKKFNAQLQTRDETLLYAKRLFGDHHSKLYEEFKQLINPKN